MQQYIDLIEELKELTVQATAGLTSTGASCARPPREAARRQVKVKLPHPRAVGKAWTTVHALAGGCIPASAPRIGLQTALRQPAPRCKQ